jgi:hypothetical protein
MTVISLPPTASGAQIRQQGENVTRENAVVWTGTYLSVSPAAQFESRHEKCRFCVGREACPGWERALHSLIAGSGLHCDSYYSQ